MKNTTKVACKGHLSFIRLTLHSFLLLLVTSINALATEYTVSSADEFNSLSLSPGDIVTWTNGVYSDDHTVNFDANGTASNPIILRAESAGGVEFTGRTTMNISGDYVIVEGFYWNEGEAASNHVQFRRNTDYANYSTIRNCAFNNLQPDGTNKHRWIVLYGTNNVVENCSFLNKDSPGALVLVELSYNDHNPVGHQIRNNYFYNFIKRDPSTTNAGDSETIRIGSSQYQDKSASVTVEGNYFQKSDGENETITNKSADNIYRNNTFRKCRGSLVLRHGARATVDGNYFLGEEVEGTGGIRISDSFHTIINNYMQNLISTNDKWNNPITLVGGSDDSGGTSNGYQKVDDILVAFNTIYNSESPIFYNDRSSYDPTGILAHNVIYTTLSDIVNGDIDGTGQGIEYSENICGGSSIGISDAGMIEADADFSASGQVYKPSSSGPAANAAGSTYSDVVDTDVEGRNRPDSDMDAGAHEVFGGTGDVLYSPYTDSDVGISIGACFLDAVGESLNNCNEEEKLSVSSLTSFSAAAGSQTLSISSNISWTASDDSSWIEVSPTSGSNNGSITVTVEANSSSSSRSGMITISGGSIVKEITVTQAGNIPVTGVTLSPSESTLSVGSGLQLITSISPENAAEQSVVYSSSNTAIADVSTSGYVSAISEGTATITVTTVDGSFTDTSIITVESPSTGVNLALNKEVTGTGTPDGSNVEQNLVDGSTATRWSVSGFPQSATIDLGEVFGINRIELSCYNDRAYQYVLEVANSEDGPYTEVVNRTDNTVQGTESSPIIDKFSMTDAQFVRITVSGAAIYEGSWVSLLELRVFGEGSSSVIPVTGISLTPSINSLLVGESQQLTTTISPANATNQSVQYSSNNTSVVIVSEGGVIIGISEGSATVSATTMDGAFTASSTVEVNDTSTPLSLDDDLENEIQIYPIPATDILNIDLPPNERFISIQVIDITGKSLMENISLRAEKNVIDISSIGRGSFFIKFYRLDGTEVIKRFMK